MFFRTLVSLAAVLLAIVCLSSCGSTSGGGTIDFITVKASASVESSKNPLFSDLATWPDQTAICSSDPAKAPSIISDLVNFTITSQATITNGTSSPLQLQSATITFTPADTATPALPAIYAVQYQNILGQTVPPGGTLSVPIEVATHSLKQFLSPALVCVANAPIYNYNVQVNFNAVESATGKSGSIPAGMTVRFADFADK